MVDRGPYIRHIFANALAEITVARAPTDRYSICTNVVLLEFDGAIEFDGHDSDQGVCSLKLVRTDFLSSEYKGIAIAVVAKRHSLLTSLPPSHLCVLKSRIPCYRSFLQYKIQDIHVTASHAAFHVTDAVLPVAH